MRGREKCLKAVERAIERSEYATTDTDVVRTVEAGNACREVPTCLSMGAER